MKEAVTKVIDTPTQEDFHGAFQKLLERHKWYASLIFKNAEAPSA